MLEPWRLYRGLVEVSKHGLMRGGVCCEGGNRICHTTPEDCMLTHGSRMGQLTIVEPNVGVGGLA